MNLFDMTGKKNPRIQFDDENTEHDNNRELVFIQNDRPMTDSLTVASVFEKNHGDVLRDLRNLGCSVDFRLCNFAESSYINEQNRVMPKYLMTEQGFVLLAMGYTGKRAMEFKEKYITEFERMRNELQYGTTREIREIAKAVTALTQMFQQFVEVTNNRFEVLEKAVFAQHAETPGAPVKTLTGVRWQKEVLLNAREIGRRVDLTAQEVNVVLKHHGLQDKQADDYGNRFWRLTEEGTEYGVEVPFHRAGFVGVQVRWRENVLDVFERPMMSSR